MELKMPEVDPGCSAFSPVQPETPKQLYLDLMKRSVTNFIYADDTDLCKGEMHVNSETKKIHCIKGAEVTLEGKLYGAIWPSKAHTMIGIPRLEILQACAEDVINNNVPGDFIETGVWRGGACIFMRAILKAYNILDRNVWVADSFEGLPKNTLEQDINYGAWDVYSDLAISLETVKNNFVRYGLLDNQVKFLKGWFKDTLPEAPINKLAILRLDGDMYESTMDALNALYDKLSIGGYVLVDDYQAVTACKEAIHDFRDSRKISSPIWTPPNDNDSVLWQKTE